MLLGLWRGAGQRCPGSTSGMLGHDPTSNSQLLGRGLQHQSWLGKLGRSRFLGDRRLYSEGLVSLLPCSFSISRLDIGVTQVPLATAQEGQWDTVSHTGTARRGTGPCHGDMPWAQLVPPRLQQQPSDSPALQTHHLPTAGNKVGASLSMEAATSTPAGLLLPS